MTWLHLQIVEFVATIGIWVAAQPPFLSLKWWLLFLSVVILAVANYIEGRMKSISKRLDNPGEQWFFNIRQGDTPENNDFAKHALKLIDMVLGKK